MTDGSNLFCLKVYIVTGGQLEIGSTYFKLRSTEILTEGEGSWNDVGNLPTAVYGIKGVSLLNKVFMTGDTIGLLVEIVNIFHIH